MTHSLPMRLCLSLGLEPLAWSLRRLHCPVPKSARVLEVGSGGNPYPRADVLCDPFRVTRHRHGEPLTTDRPTVLGCGERLPFADQSFDFVIASHVLEHSAEPEKFLLELQRVGKAGYIETPDYSFERMVPYRDHRLFVAHRCGTLYILKKQRDSECVATPEQSAHMSRLIAKHPFAFHVRFYWRGRIPFVILNPEQDANWQDEDTVDHIPSRPVLRTAVMRAWRYWQEVRR